MAKMNERSCKLLMESIRITNGHLDRLPKYEACEDCGKKSFLEKVPSCADYQTSGEICCWKYVCIDRCVYQCPNQHDNQSYCDDGEHYEIVCLQCSVSFRPTYVWYGLSIREHRQKYGW
jgi:hypothetical protein